eukprot:4676276-Amphidinium_carterae.1
MGDFGIAKDAQSRSFPLFSLQPHCVEIKQVPLSGAVLLVCAMDAWQEMSCTIAVARTQIGTPYYLSPELCLEKPYTWPSDVWAMGCILYEMCALKVPFDAVSMPKLIQEIIRGQVPK